MVNISDHDRDLMYRHGTLRWQPTPSTIYETARASLLIWRNNARVKNDKQNARRVGAQAKHQGRTASVAFLPAHLRNARVTSDVLRAAIQDIADGQKAKRIETRYLYQSIGHLQRALHIAEAKGD